LSNICASLCGLFQDLTITIARSDSNGIIVLHGPKEILENALISVQQMFLNFENNLIERIVQVEHNEVEYLQSINEGICRDDPVLVLFPDDSVDEPVASRLLSLESTGQKVFLRGQAMLRSVKVSVVRCRFEDVGGVLGCDCIINPANTLLKHVGGLARFTADTAGPEFTRDSMESVKSLGPSESW